MLQFNWWLLPLTALIPLIVGHFWHGQVFKKQWLNYAEISEERAESIKLIKVLALSYVFSMLISYVVIVYSVHQVAIYELSLIHI